MAARESVGVNANLRIEAHSDGGVRVVKTGTGASGTRVRAEATLLGRVRGPGVVTIIDSGETPDGFGFATVWIGSRSLADMPRPLSVNRAAGFCLAIGTTLQRIHGSGVVHNRIEASHVLLDDHGRPTLCGFGDATTDGRSARSDVIALAALIVESLSDEDPDREGPAPTHPERRSDRQRLVRYLASIADEAVDPVPDLGTVLETVRRLSPGATLGLAPLADAPRARPRRRRRRRATKLVACIGLAVTAAVVVGLSAPGLPTLTGASPSGLGAETHEADTDPADPTDPSVPEDAPTVELDGSLFRIGRVGDIAIARSVGCAPVASVYVLRPETEMLWVFNSIATVDRDTTPSSTSRRTGAVSIEPTVDPFTGCDALAIVFADGHRENLAKVDN